MLGVMKEQIPWVEYDNGVNVLWCQSMREEMPCGEDVMKRQMPWGMG